MSVLEGKVAIVTGGGRGVGRAAAQHLASQGALVVVADNGVAADGSPSEEDPASEVVSAIIEAGGRAVAVREPVHTESGASAIVAAAIDAYGRVDALVCCAGIARDASFLKTDAAAFRQVFEVHAVGTLLVTQAAAREMLKQGGGGHVVHATGAAGLLGNQGQVAGAAALAATYGVTRTAAIELQRHRITVNAVAPIARTRLTEELPMFQGVTTLGPEHVAPVVAFLASERCGDRTGFVVGVAGAQVYAYKLLQTPGRFKDADEPWTADELAEHWDAIVRATNKG